MSTMELDEGATVATANYEPFYIIPNQDEPAELTCSQSDFMQAALRSTTCMRLCMSRDTAERYIRLLDKKSTQALEDSDFEEALDGADNTMSSARKLREHLDGGTYKKCEGLLSKLWNKEFKKEVLLLEDYLPEAYKAAQQLMGSAPDSKVSLSSLQRKFRLNLKDKECNASLLKYLLPSNWYEPFHLVPEKGGPAELTCSRSAFIQAALRSTTGLKLCMTRDTAERYIGVLDKHIGGKLNTLADMNAAIEEALDGADNSMPLCFRRYIVEGTYEKCKGASSQLRNKGSQKEVLLLEDYLPEAYKAAQQLMGSAPDSKVSLSSLKRKFRLNLKDKKEYNASLLKYLLPSNWEENAEAATTTAMMVPMIPSSPTRTDTITTATQQDRSNEQLMALVAALASNGGGGGLNLSIQDNSVVNNNNNNDNSVHNVHNHYHAPAQQAAVTRSEMEEMLEPLGTVVQNTTTTMQNTAKLQQSVRSLSVRKPSRSSSFHGSMVPRNLEDQFTTNVKSPGEEQCLSPKVGPEFIEKQGPGFIKERYETFKSDAERLRDILGIANPMWCRDEISQDFAFPCAYLSLSDRLSDHSEEHFRTLLLDHLLQGPDAKCPIGCSVLTTKLCYAAIMIEYDERDDDWDYDQADSNANPLMPALCLTKQYNITVTLENEDGNKDNVLIVVYFREGEAANMMAAAIRAVSDVPNARTVKMEGEDTEFAHCLSCNQIAWNKSLQVYPPDTFTTWHFKLIDFPEAQSTSLALSYAQLIFESCSFKNSGTDFPQADVLYRAKNQGHEKKAKIRVCFVKAINFMGKTEEMLNNLGQAIECGTMSFLCFIDIRLSTDELKALRNVCQTALANGWNVIVDETDVDVDFHQDKHIVLRELGTEDKTKRNCDVHQYCTKAEDEESPLLVLQSTKKTGKAEQVGPISDATTKEEEEKLLPTLNHLSNNGGDGNVNHGDSTKEGNLAPKDSSGGKENAEKLSDAIGKEEACREPKDNKPQPRRSSRIANSVKAVGTCVRHKSDGWVDKVKRFDANKLHVEKEDGEEVCLNAAEFERVYNY